jgi:hypothetical protein
MGVVPTISTSMRAVEEISFLTPNPRAIALANKLARIAWAVLAKGRNFETARTDGAALLSA